MKTVLVPTDFSRESTSVIPVATQIAKAKKEKLSLFHAYGEFGAPNAERENARKRMKLLIDVYGLTDYPHRCFLKEGDVISGIAEVAGENDLSMIVACKGGNEPERIISFIVHNSLVPVLTIPRGLNLKSVNSVFYITDSLANEQETAFRAADLSLELNCKLTYICMQYRHTPFQDKIVTEDFLLRLKRKNPLIRSKIVIGPEIDFSFSDLPVEERPDIVLVERLSPLMNLNRFDKKEWIRELICQSRMPVLFYPCGKQKVKELIENVENINVSYAV